MKEKLIQLAIESCRGLININFSKVKVIKKDGSININFYKRKNSLLNFIFNDHTQKNLFEVAAIIFNNLGGRFKNNEAKEELTKLLVKKVSNPEHMIDILFDTLRYGMEGDLTSTYVNVASSEDIINGWRDESDESIAAYANLDLGGGRTAPVRLGILRKRR